MNQEPQKTTEFLNDRYVKQEGGQHYQSEFQHWDWVIEVGVGYLAGNASKYISRWRKKNGKQDLLKARTYVEKIIATRDVPGISFHFRESSYRTKVLTEKFIEVNKIGEKEASLIWILTGPCEYYMMKLALEKIDELVREAERSDSGKPPAPAP